jgi:hypothetical protein
MSVVSADLLVQKKPCHSEQQQYLQAAKIFYQVCYSSVNYPYWKQNNQLKNQKGDNILMRITDA